MILYHITPKKNLENIQALGIIPGYNKGLSTFKSEKSSFVWLTDNPNYILTTQAGHDWIRENEPVVIKINCENIDVMPYININGEKASHEYFYEGTIKQNFGVER